MGGCFHRWVEDLELPSSEANTLSSQEWEGIEDKGELASTESLLDATV